MMVRQSRQFVSVLAATVFAAGAAAADPLDPLGKIHLPIGIVNDVDTLKTFVEAEGSFSPGFATYGVYFWVADRDGSKLYAPTMEGAACEHGLAEGGLLIPWSRWVAGDVAVTTEVCQVARPSPRGEVRVAAARVTLHNHGARSQRVRLYAAVRPVGPAGGPVRTIAVSDQGDSLLVDNHPALVSMQEVGAAGVTAEDKIGRFAAEQAVPDASRADSPQGNGSGALAFDLSLEPARGAVLRFVCPVLPGRRAVGHDWDGTSGWAQLDLAEPNPAEGGGLQPDPERAFYRQLDVDGLFVDAAAYWRNLACRTAIRTPDPRWANCFAAIVGHAAMQLNEGAPDVAVVNYNVFNRDGVYVANILQKSGHGDLAAAAIDYFLSRPFNGRTRVEADNPGQVLWVMGEQWRFTRDRQWLSRAYPSAAKLAAMIRYYRTTPPPHYVKATSLEFGDGLPPDRPDERPAHRRQTLQPGSCDGHHPEYTEAFDIAGLRAAAELADAVKADADASQWRALADDLLRRYTERFGARLAQDYGSYCVLWPCRLCALDEKPAQEQFRGNNATRPGGWRYFNLARAHQGLLAGNREAGWKTIDNHLNDRQMQGWYLFDEGGGSGPGGWRFARTTWNSGAAMPHGWAIAEMWLLLRDCFAFEDGERLVLAAGLPEPWLRQPEGVSVEGLPTPFGQIAFRWTPTADGAALHIAGDCSPPGGYRLRLPEGLVRGASADGADLKLRPSGELDLPRGAREVRLLFAG